MDRCEISSDAATGPALRSRLGLLIVPCLLLVQNVFTLVTYGSLPAPTPSHWNSSGQVTAYMPRLSFVLVFVGISLGMSLLFWFIRLLVGIEPNPEKRRVAFLLLTWINAVVILITLVIQIIVTAVILHW